MNAERLLAHYERIAEAPDAIARLRRLILDLGVRGKLTNYRAATAEVTKLGRLAEFVMGQAPPGNTCNDRGEGTLFVKVGEFGDRFPEHRAWTTQPLKFARTGDVLICVVGATIGKLNLGTDCAIGRSVAAIRPCPELDQTFLYYSLMPFTLRLRENARGTAQGVISRPDLDKIAIWLPPLPEQHSIVAKIEELMALCDQLEKSRTAREETRDRLTAASLARLNDPDPETFQTDARFALDALPSMTARPDQIKQLRQTILNLAVRGKLVPQDSRDEPASELLKRIAEERAGLVKQRVIRREDELPPVDQGEVPFDIPALWTWSRIGSVVLFSQYGTSQRAVATEAGVPVLTMGNIQNGLVIWGHEKRIPSDAEHLPNLYLKRFDILYNRTNSAELVGKTGIYLGEDECRTFASYLIRLRPSLASTDPRFLNLAMNAPDFRRTQIVPLIKKQTGQANVSGTALKNMLVPIPPYAEQKRIVAKVDELMALCDRLEASLAAGETARSRLLDALLHEALEPSVDRLEVAA